MMMLKIVSMMLVTVMLLAFPALVGAEDMWDILWNEVDKYEKILDEEGKADATADCYSNQFVVEEGNTREIITIGVLSSTGSNMHPWMMVNSTNYEQEINFEAYSNKFREAITRFHELSIQLTKADMDLNGVAYQLLSDGYISYTENHGESSQDFELCYLALTKDQVFVDDELYMLVRFYKKIANFPYRISFLVAFTDQNLVFDCVKALFDNENTRQYVPTKVIEWLSRRPESGFLAPVIIAND